MQVKVDVVERLDGGCKLTPKGVVFSFLDSG